MRVYILTDTGRSEALLVTDSRKRALEALNAHQYGDPSGSYAITSTDNVEFSSDSILEIQHEYNLASMIKVVEYWLSAVYEMPIKDSSPEYRGLLREIAGDAIHHIEEHGEYEDDAIDNAIQGHMDELDDFLDEDERVGDERDEDEESDDSWEGWEDLIG